MDPLTSLALLSAALLLAIVLHRVLGRWGIPGILLELSTGFVVGNWLIGPTQVGSIMGAAELGVLVLPEGEPLIIAATIMTSGTGMAMRVLREQGMVATPSGRVLLGASVLDDFPAILLLSLAFGLARREPLPASGWPLVFSWLVPLLALLLTLLLLRFRARLAFEAVHIIPLLVLGAWVSHRFGLTSLLGALVVGVGLRGESRQTAEDFLTPYAGFLVPLYFITVGMRIPLAALLSGSAWVLGVGLFLLAFVGRILCAKGIGSRAIGKGVDSWIVTWGMVPRGLPGLVFATLAHEAGLLSAVSFLGLVLMVTLTNLTGLAGLNWRIKQVKALTPASPPSRLPFA